jgi:hypothetical protein
VPRPPGLTLRERRRALRVVVPLAVEVLHLLGAIALPGDDPQRIEPREVLTVPAVVAREIISLRPSLRTAALPLTLGTASMELL